MAKQAAQPQPQPNQDPNNMQPDPKAEPLPAVQELTTKLKQMQVQNDKMQQVLSNPTIQKVLAKLSAGEPVNLDPPAPAPSVKPEAELSLARQLVKKPKAAEGNLDALSNTELVEVIAETVEGFIGQQKESVGKNFTEEFSKMGNELKKTQETLFKVIAQQNIERIQTQHPDFEKYREPMSQILEKYPTLSIEDAYKLAKAEHLTAVPPVSQLESEKPESSVSFPEWTPNRSRASAQSGTPERRTAPSSVVGSRGFRAALDKVLDKRLGIG